MGLRPFSVDQCKDTDGYWYLASPYSKYPGGIEVAFQEVCCCAAWLLRQGVKVYSPIAHTHPIAMHGCIDPMDHGIWLPVDKPLMQGAVGLIVAKMPTWDISYGIGKEVEEFEVAGKPVLYLSWP